MERNNNMVANERKGINELTAQLSCVTLYCVRECVSEQSGHKHLAIYGYIIFLSVPSKLIRNGVQIDLYYSTAKAIAYGRFPIWKMFGLEW